MRKSMVMAITALCMLLFYQNCSQSMSSTVGPSQSPVSHDPQDSRHSDDAAKFDRMDNIEPLPLEPEEVDTPVVTLSEPEESAPNASDLNSTSYKQMKIVDEYYGEVVFQVEGGTPVAVSIGTAPCLQDLELPVEIRQRMSTVYQATVDSMNYRFAQWFRDLNMYQNQVKIILVDQADNDIDVRVPFVLLPRNYPKMNVEGYKRRDLVAMLVTEVCKGEDLSTGEEVDISNYLPDFALGYLDQLTVQYVEQLDELLDDN